MISSDTVEGCVELAAAIEGWMPPRELSILVRCAGAVPPGTAIVEVGTYRGRSAIALALGSRLGPRCPVYTFDPHLPFAGDRGGSFGPADQQALYENLARAGVGELVFSVSLDAAAVASAWPGPQVSLLLIDGDHRTPAVLRDFAAWQPHLSKDALIVFDDVDHPPVREALNQLLHSGLLEPVGETVKIAWFRAC